MVVFGGGHDDYFGSDVHAFDLACREWKRLTDGSPLPPHTYDYMQYDKVTNQLLLAKGQKELGPNVKAVTIPHLLDLTTFTWRSGPEHPWAVLNSGEFSIWDAARRLL
jgi:hypothetical protein